MTGAVLTEKWQCRNAHSCTTWVVVDGSYRCDHGLVVPVIAAFVEPASDSTRVWWR